MRPAIELFEDRCLLTTDIAATALYSDGIDLQIDYSISGSDAAAFQVALYASADGTTLDQQLQTVNADSNMGTFGPHTLTVNPDFADLPGDYYVVAVLDSANAVAETDETNNGAQFTGGSFLAIDPSTALNVLHIQGTIDADTTSATMADASTFRLTFGDWTQDYAISAIDEIHFRGHDGDDSFLGDDTVNVPMYLQGGNGNDELHGGSGDDFIFGDAGQDWIYAGSGNDALCGGDGGDELYGGSGTNTLDGGAGANSLYDTGEYSPAYVGLNEDDDHGDYEGQTLHFYLKRLDLEDPFQNSGLQSLLVTVQIEDGDAYQPFGENQPASATVGVDTDGPTTFTILLPAGSDAVSDTFDVPLPHDSEIEDTELFWVHIVKIQGGGSAPPPRDWNSCYIADASIQANEDFAVVDTDDPVEIDVLANDLNDDYPFSDLHVASFTQPAHGIVAPIYNTSNEVVALQFTRDPNYPDEDETISYTAEGDDGQQSSAFVFIILPGLRLVIHDGQNGDAVPRPLRTTLGAFTVANLNDTDGDQIEDRLDDSVVAYTDADGKKRGVDEVDLMQLLVFRPLDYNPASPVDITADRNQVAFWTSPTKGPGNDEQIDDTNHLPLYFGPSDLFRELWVEALDVSLAVRDITISASYGVESDTVKATAVWATLVAYNSDGTVGDYLLSTPPWSNLPDDSPMALAIRNTFQGTGPIPLTIGAIHNVIAEAWKPLPPGILDEPLDIDITRRRDGLTRVKYSNDAVEDGDIETYPDLLDEANDDDGRPYGPYNGYFFTFDAPGRTGLPPDTPGAKIFYSDNFEEFARISFGVNASGNTLSGSRMSAKFQWYSFSYVEFVNGAWQRVDNNAFNVITEGQNHNSPIPAP